jgi:hypothetical protein
MVSALTIGEEKMNLQEIKDQILSGKHELWSKAVHVFEQEKTPKMRLVVHRAFLVVAFRHNLNDWGLLTVPVTKENALQTIAAQHQELAVNDDGLFALVGLTENGLMFLGHSNGKPESALELASLPVGLVFVGPVAGRGWANAVVMVNIPVLAAILGRSQKEETALLEEFCFDAADEIIKELTAKLTAN